MALTFDDGPAPADRQIAAILAKYGVHATFYETGLHISQNPSITTMLANQGHLIADHSWDHYYPDQVAGGWTLSYVTDQFSRTAKEITRLTGQPVCYMRPPGGYTHNVLAAANTLRMSADMWSVDTNDWDQPAVTTAQIIKNGTKTEGRQHPVVLMHSGKASHEPDSKYSPDRSRTIAALPSIIEWYQAHGYSFVRMDGRS